MNGNTSRSISASLVIVALLAVSSLLLVACSHYSNAPLPPSAQHPPVYPRSTNVITGTVTLNGIPDAKTVTFRTSDEPNTVMAYYENLLARDGWKIDISTGGLDAYWSEGCPNADMTVASRYLENNQTEITVTLKEFGCE